MLGCESMKKPISYTNLVQLAARKPLRQEFGPGTEYSFLTIDLTDTEISLKPWLKDLPCPIIGIGQGALADGCDIVLSDTKSLPILDKNISEHPLTAMILVQHLRASESLSLTDALTAESFSYATVQTSEDFQTWLSTYERSDLPLSTQDDIIIETKGETLFITLNRPDTRNAIGVGMRDALCDALDLALANENISQVRLLANGATFSVGGALEEFGDVSSPAQAHWIRSLVLPARRLCQLTEKLSVHVNGAAIGAGVEMAAFGHYVTASSKAWFQLPELKYGLIPGAGGTASLPRRIGRQKTAYMALTMQKIRAETALDWGLIDAIID